MLRPRPLVLTLTAAWLTAAPLPGQQTLFDAPVVVTGNQSRFEQVLDLDGDGFQDAIGAWADIRGFRNDQQGHLNRIWTLPLPKWIHASAAGDLDGDGLDDFVIGYHDEVEVYRSTGAGAPTLWDSFPAATTDPGSLANLVLADFDGDGLLDLAYRDDGVRIWIQTASGFVLSDSYLPGGSMDWLSVAEVNGDSSQDLVLIQGPWMHLLSVENGQVTGADIRLHQLPVPYALDTMPVCGDIDQDGDDDIVVFGESGVYTVVRRTGPASFRVETARVGGPATQLADFDGDGDLDGLCCGGGGGGPGNNVGVSTFRFSWNNGNGLFDSAQTMDGLGAHHLAGVADLDHDGDLDLVSGRTIYYQPPGFSARTHAPLGTRPQTRASVADADSDGDPDLECSPESVFRNQGDGTFVEEVPRISAPPSGAQFAGPGFLGDYDGDGDLDLVLSEMQGTAFVGMRLLRNAGGAFLDAGPAATPGIDFNLEATRRDDSELGLARDVDGDGDVDLIVSKVYFQSQIWWNDGTGHFADTSTLIPDRRIVEVAELNGDTLPDLFTDLNTYRPGLGGGNFGAEVSFLYGPVLVSGVWDIGDADRDGDLDVVGMDWLGNTYLWTNDGNGAFVQVPLGVKLALSRGQTRFIDVNGDGWNDVLAYPLEDDRSATQILLHTTVAASYTFVKQVFEPGIVVDVDGDGDLDLLGEKQTLNRTYEGSLAGARMQYGSGSPGTLGIVPVLGASGPFRTGESAALRLQGAVAGTVGLLVVGLTPAALPDCPRQGSTCWVFPFDGLLVLPLPGTPGTAGEGSLTLAYTVPAEVQGLTLHHQFLILDPTTRWSVSNGLTLQYR